MKNLVHVKDLEDLPISTFNFFRPHRGITHQVRVRNRRRGWRFGRDIKIGDYTPYTVIKRILQKRVNTPWNDVYSEVCKVIPVAIRRKEIAKQVNLEYEHKSRRWYRNRYYIDDNGILRMPNYDVKKIWTIPSDDYKVQWILDTKTIKNRIGERLIKVFNNEFEIPWYYKDHYKKTIIQGELLEFKSKQDPKFKRIYAERKKKGKKIDREIEKKNKEQSYSMLTKIEQQRKREAIENQVSIERHGFDPKWSFTQSERRA